MKTRVAWLAAALFLYAGVAPALSRPPDPPRRPPQVWLDPRLGAQPVQLESMAIDVRVEGFVASTRIDLTFRNPNTRVLEGELVFPLADGQSITGYALDVGGALREGVVVEKETARVAFEATTRVRIDPGLAELTAGNVFRTRLYPLPAGGTRRVRLSFDQPLLDAGSVYRYLLPLAAGQTLKQFSVHAESIQAEHAPLPGGALKFDRAHDSFVADFSRADYRLESVLSFDLPKSAAPVTTFAVPDALEPAWRTFAAQVQSAPPPHLPVAAPPKRIALYYDASGSAAKRDLRRELDVLDAWFARLRDVDVDLVAFRNDADPVQHFSIHGGDAHALRAALEALPLDGGTSYGAIRYTPGSADLVAVVGDGFSNFAGHEPELAGAPRVVFLHAAAERDSGRLERLARRYGGQVLDLIALDTPAALQQLAATRWALQSVRVAGGECADLAPAAPQPAGATFALYGRCRGDATLELNFGDGAGGTLVRRVELASANVLEPQRGDFVGRLWATARIADLTNAEHPDHARIIDLAKRYGVVTADTSMLVLERIEDYVRYQVEPREPELKNHYRTALAAQAKAAPEAAQRQAHRDQVLRAWTEFRDYHAQPHPWLETVLLQQAAAEAQAWNDGTTAATPAQRAAAVARAAHAQALQQRWLTEGADPALRAAWEHEAGQAMLELLAQREVRLALPRGPDLVEGARDAGGAARAGTAGRYVRDALDQDARPAPEAPRQAERATAAPPPSPSAAVAAAPPMEMAVQAKTVAREDAGPGGAATDALRAAPRPAAGIELREVEPNAPYLPILRAAADPYAAYLKEREHRATTPAFFLDCADWFRGEGKDPRRALRILSNLAEMDYESAPLVRVLAYRLQQWERHDLAVPLFEQALRLRGEEPQSRRDLALALARQPQPDRMRAVALLWEVVDRSWDGRFPDVEVIALHELDDVLASAPDTERAALRAKLDALGVDARLLEHVPVDLRVVLTWDADNTDIDLWVIDPAGEVAMYSNPRTLTGGHVSRDFTGGYGPEVYTIRRPLPGKYTVKAHWFGSRAQKVLGAVTVQLEFQSGFDAATSKRQGVTRRLEETKEDIEIGAFTVPGP